MAFIHEAAKHGFGVAKPYGDSYRYDFILDSGERFWSVQVKSTFTKGVRGFSLSAAWHATYGVRPYSAKDIDFLVAYLEPVNAWYVIPVAAFAPRKRLRFYPDHHNPRARYEQYREAWCLMACRKEAKFENTAIARPCESSPSDFPHAAPARGCPRSAVAASRPLPSSKE